ncbi:hypothetical protein MC885_005217 [Smutsia gigantea]|nr:hypothetical protein MC885_005217 [Smutsia gigantea]
MQITWGQEPSLKARKSPPSNEPAAQGGWRGGGSVARRLSVTWWISFPPGFLSGCCPLNLPDCHTCSRHSGSLMAATCEISNVFSNYFSAMYSSEDPTLASVPPAATFGTDDLVLTLSNPQMPLEGTEKASWSGEQPQLWSKAQVLDWISYQVEKNKYDASSIDFSRCDMDGAALCSCAPEELRLVFGPLGDQLYSQLWDLSESRPLVPLGPRTGLGRLVSDWPYTPSQGQHGRGKDLEPQAGGHSRRESPFPDELSWIMELLERDSSPFQGTPGDPGPFARKIGSSPGLQVASAWSSKPSLNSHLLFPDQGSPFGQDMLEDCHQASPCYRGSCGTGAPSPGSSDVSTPGTGPSQSSRSSDSGGSDVDLDPSDSKLLSSGEWGGSPGPQGASHGLCPGAWPVLHLHHLQAFPIEGLPPGAPTSLSPDAPPPPTDGFPACQKEDPKHGKRKRGRPRKMSRESRECLEAKKSKHAPRGTHLWEFIRDILIHPELNGGLLKWENRQEGVFKFLRSEAVAQLWGQKKKNSSMTYEKLSRAMRYYYKREILERVDGRRLVYKFGKNSSGWKEEEVVGSRN